MIALALGVVSSACSSDDTASGASGGAAGTAGKAGAAGSGGSAGSSGSAGTGGSTGTCTDASECDDGDPCTTDTCDPAAGCKHAASGSAGACTGSSVSELIVIWGESNAAGTASNSPASAAELAPRPSVQILDNNTLAFADLDVGSNNNIDTGSNADSEHGLELELANQVDAGELKSPVYLVKVGFGGARVQDWLPGGSKAYWNKLTSRMDAATSALKAANTPYRITVWQSIGLNDLFSEWYDDRANTWKLFKADLDAFKQAFRDKYAPNAPFVMQKFHDDSSWAFDWNFVFDQEATEDPRVKTVDETGTTYWEQNVHWDYGGFKVLTPRFVKATQTLWP